MNDDPQALLPPPGGLLRDASLFLDFDGTLVELQDRPDAVTADISLRDLIARLGAVLDGRLAIVTGRAIEHIEVMFDGLPFAVAGSHGVEFRWPDGRDLQPSLPPTLDAARAEVHAFAASREHVLVETKPFGVGLHYRMAPQHEDDARVLAERLADEHALHLQPGKMMIELRGATGDKGTAITRLMEDAPFAGTRPVFLGDDVTDEDGFHAVAALGGVGILVGDARPTAAGYRLADVAQVRAWLQDAAQVTA
ncbi:trehalose-phosphatase [Sphingomonas sp. S1-29]|uniref:Trehalose 6-phosphate phosphatase n=1 Tax=Sphingomonas qomolangmaensis TaxID=2918765 RepID=A0ABY5LAN0_9SPHN|nr:MULTISPECIES: trehalose-phosphatase [Sphingomonas]UUL83093.1 trehalose-phosphatase [Sphingomonas qomolangmaensis]UZK69616.1 trehalose-phosphatase [Sphingomonas sp. S1-29]